MKPLLLLTIAIALTPTSYAAQTIDRDKYNYYCPGDKVQPRVYDNNVVMQDCIGLEKGDLLNALRPLLVVLYCDKDKLIIKTTEEYGGRYDCIYNGREIKTLENLE